MGFSALRETPGLRLQGSIAKVTEGVSLGCKHSRYCGFGPVDPSSWHPPKLTLVSKMS